MVTHNKSIFLFALVITLIIFAFGFVLGQYMDNFRVNDVDLILKQSELDTESLIVENYFSDVFGLNDCKVASSRFKYYSDKLAYVGNTLTGYENKRMFNKEDYELLKRRYFLLELRTYSLIKNLKDKCGFNNFDTILFFYDPNSEESLKQGSALDKVVLNNKDLYVFSIDRTFDESLINIVEEYYNITTSPTIILNYDIKKQGFISSGEIKEIL